MFVSRDENALPLRLRLLPLLSVTEVGPEAGCQYYRIYRICGPRVDMVKVAAPCNFTRWLVVNKPAMNHTPIDLIRRFLHCSEVEGRHLPAPKGSSSYPTMKVSFSMIMSQLYTCEVSSDPLVKRNRADQALRSASQDVTLSNDALQLLYALGCGCTCRGMTPGYHCGCGCSHCLVLK